MDKTKIIRLAKRFLRASIAGSIATMIIVLPFQGNTWDDIQMWLGSLFLAGFVGGLTGLIMAIDKYFRN
ncbi:MAG: hypothetical protein GWP19_01835 [Planctomycetia bacterium]|nr:hypothetical protein [Planctomycetia bacterium]